MTPSDVRYPTDAVKMRRVSDTRIAQWMSVSPATLYRWREAGLLPCRPSSAEEARQLRVRIDAAWDIAAFRRSPGRSGRTPLEAVARELGGGS
jgi:hypothetical protein